MTSVMVIFSKQIQKDSFFPTGCHWVHVLCTSTLSCHYVMIENHVNLTIIETGTHILTHVIEYDKNRTKNKTIVVKNR